MIFNMTGSGARLNFKVKAYASELLLPAAAAENTIAVITETAISSYVFSAEEPEAPDEGMVWFPTGSTSYVAFNALKKNDLRVYPKTAKQYIGGAWVIVPSKFYQNGTWNEPWDGILYNAGDEYIPITGGWEKKSGIAMNSSAPNTGTATKSSTGMYVYASNVNTSAFFTTKEKIDLTDYSTITFVNSASDDSAYVGIHAHDTGYINNSATAVHGWVNGLSGSKDISHLSGEFYVSIGTWNNGKCTSKKIYLS